MKIQLTSCREGRGGLRRVQIGLSLIIRANKFLFVYSVDTGRRKTDRKSSDRTGRGFERKEGTRKNLSLENKPGGEQQSAVLNGMSQASVCSSVSAVTCVHLLMCTCEMTKPGEGVRD